MDRIQVHRVVDRGLREFTQTWGDDESIGIGDSRE